MWIREFRFKTVYRPPPPQFNRIIVCSSAASQQRGQSVERIHLKMIIIEATRLWHFVTMWTDSITHQLCHSPLPSIIMLWMGRGGASGSSAHIHIVANVSGSLFNFRSLALPFPLNYSYRVKLVYRKELLWVGWMDLLSSWSDKGWGSLEPTGSCGFVVCWSPTRSFSSTLNAIVCDVSLQCLWFA